MKSYILMGSIVLVGSAVLGMLMAEQFSIMLYAMIVLGSIFLGIIAAHV